VSEWRSKLKSDRVFLGHLAQVLHVENSPYWNDNENTVKGSALVSTSALSLSKCVGEPMVA